MNCIPFINDALPSALEKGLRYMEEESPFPHDDTYKSKPINPNMHTLQNVQKCEISPIEFPIDTQTREKLTENCQYYRRCKTKLEILEAKRAEAIQKVDEQFQSQIEALRSELESVRDNIEMTAERHRIAIGKSMALGSVLLGFRTPPPRVNLLKDAEEILVSVPPEFIRTKRELNREAILSSRLSSSQLFKMGLLISQTKMFYISVQEGE